MQTHKNIMRTSALAALLLVGALHCQAATIVSGTATPHEAYLSKATPEASFNFEFEFAHYNNEKLSCGAAINFGDGQPQQLVTVTANMPKMELAHKYSVANTYSVSLAGFAHSGMPACLGSQTPTVKVAIAIQVAMPSKLNVLEVPPSPVAPTSAMDLPVKLRSSGNLAECGYSAHLFQVGDGGADALTAEVASQNGTTALPAESLVLHLGSIDKTGHYRLDVTGVKNCSGTVSAQFDVQRSKLDMSKVMPVLSGMSANFDQKTHELRLELPGTSPQGILCPLRVEVHSDDAGKTSSQVVARALPTTQGYFLAAGDFQAPTMPYGHYSVTVKPLPSNELLGISGATQVCLGGVHTASFDIPRPVLGDVGLPALDIAFINVTTSGSPASGSTSAYGPIIYADRMHTASAMLGVKTTHPDNAKNGCGFTIDIDNGFKTVQLVSNSLDTVDMFQRISQTLGWYGGDYKIKLHATAANKNPSNPPCLGKKELTLSVRENAGTILGMSATSAFNDTWDSSTYLPQFFIPFYLIADSHIGDIYGTVTLKPRIAGNACSYSISLEASGQVPKFTASRMHSIEGGDDYTFEVYRGANTQETMNNVHNHFSNIPYSLVVKATPSKGSAVACNGEYRDDNFHLPL